MAAVLTATVGSIKTCPLDLPDKGLSLLGKEMLTIGVYSQAKNENN